MTHPFLYLPVLHCTRSKVPSDSTTISYLSLSPNGIETGISLLRNSWSILDSVASPFLCGCIKGPGGICTHYREVKGLVHVFICSRPARDLAPPKLVNPAYCEAPVPKGRVGIEPTTTGLKARRITLICSRPTTPTQGVEPRAFWSTARFPHQAGPVGKRDWFSIYLRLARARLGRLRS